MEYSAIVLGVHNASPSDSESSRLPDRLITAAELESVRPLMARSAGAILRRPEDIEDAVQEALLRMLRSHTRLDSGRGTLVAFAATTVRRVALDMLRRRAPVAVEKIEEPAASETAAEPLDAPQLKNRLRAAVDKLADAQRTAFLLVHQEGLSHADAARELRISQTTLRSRLFRARGQLRNLLKDLRP